MSNYEHTNRAQLRTIVYDRLGEDGVFWPESEINLSIDEALLTFGALSGFWREEIFFATEENKRLYDLFSDLNSGSAFIYPSLTYQYIIDLVNRDLIENISVANPNSEFLNLDELLKLIETKYNLFQQLTNLVVYEENIPVAPGVNVVNLPDNVIDIIRVSFISAEENGIKYFLRKVDEAELSYFDSNVLSSNGPPFYYTSAINKSKSINIYPAPHVIGTIKLLFIGGRETTTPLDVNTNINLPNNLVPYLKYGVLADIFGKEGVTQDLARAAYCKQRWEEGIQIGLVYNSVLLAKANGNIILTDSLANIDLYYDSIKVRTAPTVLGFAGFNLFQTNIVPSSAIASISLLITANAKLPVTDEDFIRVDLEYINPLIDYVVHISRIKTGAAELAQTEDLKNNFIKTSLAHNARVQFRGLTYESLVNITKKEELSKPRVVR